jgi:hypothetical protein
MLISAISCGLPPARSSSETGITSRPGHVNGTLIQIHYMQRRFGRADEGDIEAFTTTYGWDVRGWPGVDALVAIREITGLSHYIRTARTRPFSGQQLAYRLRTLQAGDTTARWEAPPAE